MSADMPPFCRRRFLTLTACASLAGISPGRAATLQPITWSGRVMGADATITLYHSDTVAAEKLLNRCRQEISRLENQLSLFQPDSAVSRLNRDGKIENAPDDFLQVLRIAMEIHQTTEGAFDITVQPLWQLYAGHFAAADANPLGPCADDIAAAVMRTGQRHLQIDEKLVYFQRPEMALTLNGIAQGYITDQIAIMLRTAGMEKVLLDLGEFYAIGAHPSGRPWRIGLKDPVAPWRTLTTTALSEGALATSGGYGTPFEATGKFHHLFDPGNGRPASYYRALSVMGPDATRADALSTGLYALPLDKAITALNFLGRGWGGIFITAEGVIHRHNWPITKI